MKHSYLIGLLLGATSASGAFAAIPTGYYKACEGKTQRALKSQLYSIIKDHEAIPYGSGSNSTWGAFYYTDVDESDNTYYDIYTTKRAKVGSCGQVGSGMNIEHTFPKSWWGGGKNNAYKDIGHLMPSESKSNSTRGNNPYAEVENVRENPESYMTFKRGTPKSGQGGGASLVIEPEDKYKGDLARNYFYMVTCYQNLSWSSEGLNTAAQGDYPTLQQWAIEMLLKWHRQDPVSDKERKRNDALYDVQGNRNPFIDYPELAEHIWGNLQDKPWKPGGSSDPDPVDPVLTSPEPEDIFSVGNVKLGESNTITIPVLGSGFTHAVNASITGTNADMYKFVVAGTEFPGLSIQAADVNNKNGYYLTLKYTPTSITPENECHTATVTLSSQDINPGPLKVYVQGTCEEDYEMVPTVAYEAEDVTATSYTARWAKSMFRVDGYLLTRQIYNPDGIGVAETYTYEIDGADTTSYEITDRDANVNEAYFVQCTWGDKYSEPSNTVTVLATNGVEAIEAVDSSEAEYYTPEGVRLPGKPSQPGVYLIRQGDRTLKSVRF